LSKSSCKLSRIKAFSISLLGRSSSSRHTERAPLPHTRLFKQRLHPLANNGRRRMTTNRLLGVSCPGRFRRYGWRRCFVCNRLSPPLKTASPSGCARRLLAVRESQRHTKVRRPLPWRKTVLSGGSIYDIHRISQINPSQFSTSRHQHVTNEVLSRCALTLAWK
jgi:hypothetical protein